MDDLKWSALAQISAFARTQMHVLRDAHLVSLGEGPLYGSAALEAGRRVRGARQRLKGVPHGVSRAPSGARLLGFWAANS